MAGGRPRTVSPTPDECVKLGKEMVNWVLENDPLHLSQWYTIHKGYIYKDWKALIQIPQFLPYYEKALKLVGLKYIDGESKKIKQGIAERWQRVYFQDLRELENEDVQFKADVNRKSEVEVSGGLEVNALFGFCDNTSKDLVDKSL